MTTTVAQKFTVTGMTCSHCERAVDAVAAAVDEAGYELAR